MYLIRRAFHSIECSEFAVVCSNCTNLDEIRNYLALDPKAVNAQRRARKEREEKHQRETVNVADISFEVGTMNFRELFDHLDSLPDHIGPYDASQDMFTPLVVPSFGGRSGRNDMEKKKISQLRLSPQLRELIGIIGEMRAYRFLRQKFGDDSITQDTWVSKIRLKALPLVERELDKTSDGHGFDFQFSHQNRRWHIEVKSTIGDDSQFELGISEIEAATRFARERGGIWKILRIRNVLSVEPAFDWLPNPFEEGFKEYFHLQQGGMRISYMRKQI